MLLSKKSRDKFRIDEEFVNKDGRIKLSSLLEARKLVQEINNLLDEQRRTERLSGAELYALYVFNKALHEVLNKQSQANNTDIIKNTLESLSKSLGEKEVKQMLIEFVENYPPTAVFKGEETAEDYLNKKTEDNQYNRDKVFEDLIYLWLLKSNNAIKRYMLFIESELEKSEKFNQFTAKVSEELKKFPKVGRSEKNLAEFLLEPFKQYPNSLEQQLNYIAQNWKELLGKLTEEIDKTVDALKEETMFRGPGPGEIHLPTFEGLPEENYTPDRSWMPKLVLIAKNTYVWLDQLSKKYGKKIQTLGDIPEEELKKLAEWGITGLWLIGIWERSKASKRIKQLTGNIDAEASAYSIYDYVIAEQLGGEKAYQELKRKAEKYNIKLACDMVPNHTAIDAKWIYEHPEWFIQLNYSPFPSYSFNGENLSSKEDIGIYLEDHYYTRTDAAVVFKWKDFRTKKTRYIYHGNDGTSMPWNDTAQLNYLLPKVRNAVIETILTVAKKFSVIRFDAAMTLTKMHYQRLWWPKPGTGGAIPSRAEHGMSEEEFNKHIPKEFWREVVDRVNAEAPDTLLLAEAFWLLEGYFVRTLGMHRVYNSAFMHMLKNEENSKFRDLIKKTLEFDPEILKRYVNFMSNPDEEVAAKQFGKEDKYFGVCLLLATMPGLPMIAHGQIEGFEEKYGMEYKRAYWDEKEDKQFIERHEKEIFPLLKKRYLFAEVKNFVLYDVTNVKNEVIEDVFAYTNKWGNEKALIVYHNKYNEVTGWIKNSVPYKVKNKESKCEGEIRNTKLAEELELHNEEGYYVIFRDNITNLEYIRNSKEIWEKGIYVELKAYKYHAFLDFKEVKDEEQLYGFICKRLRGRGVKSIKYELIQARINMRSDK